MNNQDKLDNKLIIRLEKYKTKNFIKARKKVLESAIKLFHVRENVVNYCKKGIFPFKGNVFKTKEEKSAEIKEETKE